MKSQAQAKCPVCNYDIDGKAAPIKVGGKVILVSCEGCERKVRANPARYINGK